MKKQKLRTEIIAQALMDLEFLTGLKQIKEYTKQDLSRLIDSLDECFGSYRWMTSSRIETILKQGMMGYYGDFFHINVRTISQWIEEYRKRNDHQIKMELMHTQDEVKLEPDPNEIQRWLEIDRQNFIKLYSYAKDSGNIPHLSDFGPHWFQRFLDAGFIDYSEINVQEIEQSVAKTLRLTNRFYSQTQVQWGVKTRVWNNFIQDSINKGFSAQDMIDYANGQ